MSIFGACSHSGGQRCISLQHAENNSVVAPMRRTVEEICALVEGWAAAGQLSEALEATCDLVMDVISRETTLGKVLASPQLDQTCLKLGRLQSLAAPETRNDDQVVFLVTALYRGGGHSRVLLDLMQAEPARQFKVLFTNLRHDYPPKDIEDVFRFVGGTSSDAIEIAPPGDAESRLRWIQQRLFELRPVRTYLLQHNYDSIAIAAAQPELTGRLIYIHHCDHSLTLGMNMPHATHVDFDPRIFHSCRDHVGIADNVMWQLTAHVAQERFGRPFLADGHLRTCTSGGTHKFDALHFKEHLPYAVTYPSIVPVILREGGGTHLHIGELSERMLQAIRDELTNAGIAPERFVNIPVVPNLAAALVEHRIDAYVGSFPYGGGRATVEVMGAGVPIIQHSNYRSTFFSTAVEAYPGVMFWRSAAELSDQLRGLTPDLLQAHAQMARRHYEAHHAPAVLSAAMKQTLDADGPEPPPRPSYHPDTLQNYLDEYVLLGPARARGEEHEKLGREIEDLSQKIADYKTEINALKANGEERQAELAKMEAERDALATEVAAMRDSPSWRVTAGLRAASEALAKFRRS